MEMGRKEDTRTSQSVSAAARHGVGDNDVEDGEVSICCYSDCGREVMRDYFRRAPPVGPVRKGG